MDGRKVHKVWKSNDMHLDFYQGNEHSIKKNGKSAEVPDTETADEFERIFQAECKKLERKPMGRA